MSVELRLFWYFSIKIRGLGHCNAVEWQCQRGTRKAELPKCSGQNSIKMKKGLNVYEEKTITLAGSKKGAPDFNNSRIK